MHKTFNRCPTCGCNVPIHNADEGTNSFIPVNFQVIEELIEKVTTLSMEGLLNG